LQRSPGNDCRRSHRCGKKKKKEVTWKNAEEEGGYMVRTRNYVANDDQKNRAVRNAGHHP
jgi:hypothetical protein